MWPEVWRHKVRVAWTVTVGLMVFYFTALAFAQAIVGHASRDPYEAGVIAFVGVLLATPLLLRILKPTVRRKYEAAVASGVAPGTPLWP